jgi:hypothetical protein
MDVSVIIVSFNTKDLTINCIKSVKEKTTGLSYEIIVVDNNSNDFSTEEIENKFPDVIIIKNDFNIGFGKANNKGINKAKGKYLFLLNSDTYLINNALKIFFDFMEMKENINIACCGGSLLNEDLTPHISFGRFPKIKGIIFYYLLSKLFPDYYADNYFMAGVIKNDNIIDVDYVTGADMFIRKSVIEKVGVFDDDFFLYFEETELCSRFIKAGFKNVIIPEAKIVHLCGKSPLNSDKQKIFNESMFIYMKKHKGKFYTFIYRSISGFFRFFSKIIKNFK